MKKQVFGRQLNRDTNERKALFKGLINELVMRESIQTTEAKAKAIRGEVEKLITKAKKSAKGGSASGRKSTVSLLQPWLQPAALTKVMDDLSVRFAKRPGGYTRVITLGERFGDNATMAVIEFVEKKAVVVEAPKAKETHSASSEQAKEKVEATVKTEKSSTKKETKKPTKKEAK